MGKLDRRIAIVTGAATGLGKAIALLYAAEGADVAVIDRNADGYVRRMYGDVEYTVIDRVESLPIRLPRIYQRLAT